MKGQPHSCYNKQQYTTTSHKLQGCVYSLLWSLLFRTVPGTKLDVYCSVACADYERLVLLSACLTTNLRKYDMSGC
jgi:hypothetical protein